MPQFIQSTKQIVAVCVTPNIGLEVAVMDRKSPTIVKYGRRALDYNISIREIQDYNAFKQTIVELFKDLDISLKSSIYLVLPNVHLDFESLPLIINEDSINNAILAKAEDSYAFAKVEPISAWTDLQTNATADKRLIVYSSLQQNVIDEVKDIFQELGSTLVGIESSYSALIRGLWFSGRLGDADENSDWNLLLINSNSYALFAMAGAKLVNYTEVSLAIKSFSYEEAYEAISTSVASQLPNFPARKLVIISQAEDVSAEVLKTQIMFNNEIVAFDSNKYAKNPIINCTSGLENEAKAMTFPLVGALAVDHLEEPVLNLNLLSKSLVNSETYFSFDMGSEEIVVNKELTKKIFIGIAAIIGIFAGLLYGLGHYFNKTIKAKQAETIKATEITQQSIQELKSQSGVVDIGTLISRVIDSNKQAVSFYDAISVDIPKSMWLNYYYNKDGDKVIIKGISSNIADIYDYYKHLKVVAPQSSIKLNKLEILTQEGSDNITGDTGSRFYDFEISNTTKSAASQQQVAAPQDYTNMNAPDMNNMQNMQPVPPPSTNRVPVPPIR